MSLWPVWASNQGSIWAGEECSAIDDDDDDENNYIETIRVVVVIGKVIMINKSP